MGAAVAFGSVAVVGGWLWTLRRTRRAAASSVSDAKAKRGGPAQRRTARGEPYEVSYFARKHRISAAEARAIIKQAGPDRKAANRLASERAK
ncbi:hypothetical protein [Sphingomonas immobilis]|uniref:DUF3606 domain-containing protein n=1 Tax=Sphingomonas immobilis TaxID=3063997 RepID=A0ABT8ZWI7_9SPHN|nr:hypothetical protein [Sphingomonas sp. CA1-15]MDO7841914.1 hypothetical protein [Sphingomonas sp. CA1-15]